MATHQDLAAMQARAAALFQAIETNGIVRAGETEDSISRAIQALAAEQFGVQKHWHRRVVRSGPNTRLQFSALTPDRTIETDDIVSLDLGPVFESFEADFGRTFVLGDDPEKIRLNADLETIFRACQSRYLERPNMTGAELFAHVVETCARSGWGFGGAHAGHLIGDFPDAANGRNEAKNRIRPDNGWPMDALDGEGAVRHWVLEVHLLDPTGAFGGFYEQLLMPVAP